MRKISKGLAIAAAVVAIGGVSLVAVARTAGPGYGPGGFGPMGYGAMGFMHGHGGPGMMGGWGGRGFADPAARLDALKTELGIRPEQTAAWDAYVKAVRDGAAQMQAAHGGIDFDKLRAMSWADMQSYMGALHDKQAAAFKSVQAAATTLLAALDDGQKTHALLPALENAGPGMMAWGGGPPMMGPGGGMMQWGSGSNGR
ncbi:MAG TPA: Spy/CpxP family protein refolding chaperone [Acetobacteraceae bacterium]|nr:Spy/CpxP family protein refolding chaperone [Acetobacteraceae bacterium]